MNPLTTTLATTTTIGLASGIAYGAYNKNYGVGIYGSNLNDPNIGYMDYAIHGAVLGSAAGLASAGLRLQAHAAKTEKVSEATMQMYRMLSK